MRRFIAVAGLLLILHGCTPVVAVAARQFFHLAHHRQRIISKTLHWSSRRLLVTAYAKDCCQCDFKVTASNTVPTIGTVAVDPSVFPFGTRFIIPGYGYGIARDTGGAVIGNHIDIVEPDCTTAVNWGPRHIVVKYDKPRNKSALY